MEGLFTPEIIMAASILQCGEDGILMIKESVLKEALLLDGKQIYITFDPDLEAAILEIGEDGDV